MLILYNHLIPKIILILIQIVFWAPIRAVCSTPQNANSLYLIIHYSLFIIHLLRRFAAVLLPIPGARSHHCFVFLDKHLIKVIKSTKRQNVYGFIIYFNFQKQPNIAGALNYFDLNKPYAKPKAQE
jgi:hypothetical protein